MLFTDPAGIFALCYLISTLLHSGFPSHFIELMRAEDLLLGDRDDIQKSLADHCLFLHHFRPTPSKADLILLCSIVCYKSRSSTPYTYTPHLYFVWVSFILLNQTSIPLVFIYTCFYFLCVLHSLLPILIFCAQDSISFHLHPHFATIC